VLTAITKLAVAVGKTARFATVLLEVVCRTITPGN
jgi:hypothetical protein